MHSWSGNYSPGGISLGSKRATSHLHLGTELCPKGLIMVNSSSSWPGKWQTGVKKFSCNGCHSSISLNWTKISFQRHIHKHWMGKRKGRKEREEEGGRRCSCTAASLSLSHDMHSFGPLIPAFLSCLQPIFILPSAFFCRHFTLFRYTPPHQLSFFLLLLKSLCCSCFDLFVSSFPFLFLCN